MRKKDYLFLLLCSLVLLVIGTLADYPISQLLVNPTSLMGGVFAYYVNTIVFLFLFVSVSIIYFQTKITYLYGLSLLVSVYSSVSTFKPILQGVAISLVVGLIVHLGILLLIHYLVSCLPEERRQRFFHLAVLYVGMFVFNLIIVHFLKILGGRIRFRDLKGIEDYRPWWIFFTHMGIEKFNSSFPSGHVAIAGNLLLIDLFFAPKKRLFFQTMGMILFFLMAFYRIVVGAHYLSDVSFSLLFSLMLAFIIRRYYEKAVITTT